MCFRMHQNGLLLQSQDCEQLRLDPPAVIENRLESVGKVEVGIKDIAEQVVSLMLIK